MVQTGAQRLLTEPAVQRLLRGRAWAMICHGASVDGGARYVLDGLCAMPEMRPAFLLVPEHGLFGEQRYMEEVPDCLDGRTGLRVVSLYGASERSLAPAPDLVRGLGAVVFDLQDIGARYYTYLATMAMTMEVCAATGVKFVVLDRPNPTGGLCVEGNTVEPCFRSFVGYLPVPNRHGMTAGEAALFWRRFAGLDLDLTVIECRGLLREHLWPGTGLPFVPPSPNIPSWETALVYPGMCLLEGTNLSEGRGTTTPFFVLGAPYCGDPWVLSATLDREGLDGVRFRPLFFAPSADKWAGRRCGGVQVIVTDPLRFRPLLTGLTVVAACMRLYPEFDFRREAYEFVEDRLAIDLLLGSPRVRDALAAGVPPREIAGSMESETRLFQRDFDEFRLYQ